MRFYRNPGPTVILTRDWMEEPLEIDELLKEHHGSKATWSQVFAYDDIADNLYWLFKKGYEKFFLDEIHFKRDLNRKNVWSIIIDTKVIATENVTTPI